MISFQYKLVFQRIHVYSSWGHIGFYFCAATSIERRKGKIGNGFKIGISASPLDFLRLVFFIYFP